MWGCRLACTVHGPCLARACHDLADESNAVARLQIKGMFQMILVANLTHIAPWSVTLGLFRGTLAPRLAACLIHRL